MSGRLFRWLPLLAVCLLLSACSPFRPVSDLLTPPQYSDEDARLQKAFEAVYGSGIQYKMPVSGEYLSSFLVEDLDHDGEREALVFYTPDAMDGTVHMAVFDLVSDSWQSVQEIECSGSEVYSVQLTDMDLDGETEVILCSSAMDNSRVMSIFSCASDAFSLVKLAENAYSAMTPTDLNADGQTEIFMILLYAESGSQSAQARVLQKTANGVRVLDKRYLDGKVTGYGSIEQQRTDTGCVLYVDAYQGESSMITEVIVWNSASASMSVPLLDSESRSNIRTVRYTRIAMRDVDGDGVPEIPCQDTVFEDGEIRQNGVRLASRPYLTRWCAFRDGSLECLQTALVRNDGSCMFSIPVQWEGRFSFVSYSDSGKWDFYQIDPASHTRTGYLFSVIFTTQKRWTSEKDRLYLDYSVLQSSGDDMVLVYGVNTESPLGLTEDMLRDSFTMLRQ